EVFGDEAGQEFEDVRWGVGGAVGVEAVLGQVEVFWDPFELAGAFKTAVPVGVRHVGRDVSGGPCRQRDQQQVRVDLGTRAEPGRMAWIPVHGGDVRVDKGEQVPQ